MKWRCQGLNCGPFMCKACVFDTELRLCVFYPEDLDIAKVVVMKEHIQLSESFTCLLSLAGFICFYVYRSIQEWCPNLCSINSQCQIWTNLALLFSWCCMFFSPVSLLQAFCVCVPLTEFVHELYHHRKTLRAESGLWFPLMVFSSRSPLP